LLTLTHVAVAKADGTSETVEKNIIIATGSNHLLCLYQN
jgi:pyruvate/2-oxoglutarate dehydrogenase complex dihydrolipoamide dehydrogenase (E3) component